MIYPFPPPKFNIELLAPQITITLDTPSKGDFYALTAGTDPVKILSRYTDARVIDAVLIKDEVRIDIKYTM